MWEAKIGQISTMGTRNWKIMRITHNDVFVLPARISPYQPSFLDTIMQEGDLQWLGLKKQKNDYQTGYGIWSGNTAFR